MERESKVYAYLRISKKKRSKDDSAELAVKEQTERQEMMIEDYCKAHDINFNDVEFYRDIISGKITNEKRESYSKMKPLLQKGDTVIITEISRLGRDFRDTEEEYYWYLDNGVNLIVLELDMLCIDHSVKNESIDMTYLKRSLISMYTYMAQKTRENISINTSQALQAKKRKGQKLGRPKQFTQDEELDIVRFITRHPQATFRQIADRFGIKSTSGVAKIFNKYNIDRETRIIKEDRT